MEKPNGRHTLTHNTYTHTHTHTCNTIVGCCIDLNTSACTHTHMQSLVRVG
jgi:hypothetical protein